MEILQILQWESKPKGDMVVLTDKNIVYLLITLFFKCSCCPYDLKILPLRVLADIHMINTWPISFCQPALCLMTVYQQNTLLFHMRAA